MKQSDHKKITAGDSFLLMDKAFLKHFGPDTSCFLSILIEWRNHLIDIKKIPKDGYFYLEQSRIEDNTCMSAFVQRKNINLFVDLGFLIVERKGIPRKNWYFVDDSKYDHLLKYLRTRCLKIKPMDIKKLGLYYSKTNYNNTKLDTTISIDIVNRVSDETPNDSNSKKPRQRNSRNKIQAQPNNKFRRRDPRKKPPVKNSIPPYVINIINKWNSYPDTTSHKLDLKNPNKTIQSIHRYLIQLKTGKMSGLDSDWIKDNKIPRSFLTRKWTEEELFQGIEYLSKFSQNDYWPKDGKDNFKNLSNLLYNTTSKKSLFLQVMNRPPEKISIQQEIKHPIKTARFMKADIWANNDKPSEYDLDRQLRSVVDFFIYLRPYVAPTEACMGYDLSHGETPKLHTYFYDNYISFLENTPYVLKNANPQPLSSVGWAFKAYIADIWDDLPHIPNVLNPVKLLEKFNKGK